MTVSLGFLLIQKLTDKNLDVRQKTGSSTSNQVLMVKYRQTKLPVVDPHVLFWLFLFLTYIL